MGASQGKVALAQGFATLQREPRPSTDPLWDTLLQVECTEVDLFAALSPAGARAIVDGQPNNLRVLLEKTIGTCHNYVACTRPPTAAELTAVSNSVAILSRLLPFVIEVAGSPDAKALLWAAPAASFSDSPAAAYEDLCLALRLLRTTCELLFRPDLSLGPRADVATERIICIDGLVSVGGPMQTTAGMDARCGSALKLILACLSSTLFTPPEKHGEAPDRFLGWVTSKSNSLAAPMFAALLNLALGHDSDGWGLPYKYLLSPEAEREQLVDVGLHVLVLLLDYTPPQGGTNVFVELLSALNAKGDLDLIYQGFARLLANPNAAANAMLPGSTKAIGCQEELAVLLWKFLDLSPAFLAHGKQRRPAGLNPFLEAACFFIASHLSNGAKSGLVHICVFILLLLSGERDFSVALNDPVANRFPPELASSASSNHTDTCADLLMLTLHKLLMEGRPAFASLQTCCLTVVANTTPYLKAFSPNAADRLLAVFDALAMPVAAATKQSTLSITLLRQQTGGVALLLESLNNLLQYQSEGHARITYALVRRKALLAVLTVAPTLTEVGLEADAVLGSWASQVTPRASVLLNLAEALLPPIESFAEECAANESAASEEEVVAFLERYTLVGLLPVPHPILIRKYQPNDHTELWFSTYIWGVIYLKQQRPPLFDSGTIKLFSVHYTRVGAQTAGDPAPEHEPEPEPT